MSTVGKIDIKSETLGHALLDNTLTVPINQRSYAWEKKHVLELFQDIANAIAQHEPEYFLGSIVVTKKESGRPEVVDGQQRLATTAILLAAMRDFFHKNNEGNRASDLQRDYLIRRDLVTQEPLPRLILNEIDREYFTKRVLSEPGTPERQILATKESHHRIDAASNLASDYVKTIVKGYSVQDQSERLLEWIKFITDGARVIWVNVPDDANAYVMFETLNDRGLELSKADLLKNYLFGRSQDRLQETQQRWFLMLGALETVGGEELTVTYIRHLWSSMHGPTRERELFSEIKGTIKSKQAAIGLANDLGENANLYAAILNPSHSFWNDFAPSTRKHIATLQQLQMQQVRPLLLAVATLPKVEVARALRLLVNYSVRFLIVGGLGGGALEDQYARLAIKIRSNKITTAKTLAQELGKVVPLDVAFRSSFETATVSKSYLARYYLRALQLRADGNAEPEYVPADDESINLEHILPQSLSSVWSHIDHETAQAFYRRLGNMVLLKADVNAVIGNDAFTKKKQVYKKSEYSLTAEVANSSQWGTTEINDRQKKLAALALKTWPLSV